MSEIIRQKQWTKQQLQKAGFRYYNRKKSLVMARRLPEAEAPLTVHANHEMLTVQAGYMICYNPGKKMQKRVEDYEQWPCDPEIFRATYKAWDLPWKPGSQERQLLERGCKPYYKHTGVWAKRLTEDIYVQSMESPEPVLLTAGNWLVIHGQEHPYHMSHKAFCERYTLHTDSE